MNGQQPCACWFPRARARPTPRTREPLGTLHATNDFLGGTEQSAVVGEISHLQLFNPPGSNIVVRVQRIEIGPAAGGAVHLQLLAAALTSLTRAGFQAYLTGARSKAQLRNQTNAVELGTRIGSTRSVTNQGVPILFKPGLLIPQGTGLVLRWESANVFLSAFFWWSELPADPLSEYLDRPTPQPFTQPAEAGTEEQPGP